jgi:hypothetical protein
MGTSRARHRAPKTSAAAPVVGVTGIAAAAGAALMGMAPTLPTNVALTAASNVWYLRGTNIGSNPTDDVYEEFVGNVLTNSDPADAGAPKRKVDYPASFWPVSTGGLSDPTFDASVAKGLAELNGKPVQNGDVIYGFSQGAVVASEYKGQHSDPTDPATYKNVTYVLVENPDRPNGGVLERFAGLSIPILGVTFNGATPNSGPTGPHTVDVSRQYDGWSDFPAYPLNVLADANAIAGIYYLHGKTQTDVDFDQLETLKGNGDPTMYYQNDKDTNTEYYLIPTDQLPILMPFNGIVPKPILDAVDPPLRVLVELGYDRSDYGKPTTAGIAPVVNPVTVASELATATVAGVQKGLGESGVSSASTPASAARVEQTPAVVQPTPTVGQQTPAAQPDPVVPTLPKLPKKKDPVTSVSQKLGSATPIGAQAKSKSPSVRNVTNDVTKSVKKAVKDAADAVSKLAPKKEKAASGAAD